MRTLRLAGPFLGFVAAFATYGCALDVSGLAPTTASGSGGESTGVVTGGGGTPSGTGGATISSSVTSASGCVETPEICDDGVDNDCDNLVDCADNDCTTPAGGRECVAPAPAGWTLVAFAPGDTAACPAGYEGMVKVAEAPSSTAAQCVCNCECPGTANNPCVHGTLSAKIGSNCTAATLTDVPVTGGCDALGQTFPFDYQTIKGTPLPVKAIDSSGKTILPGTNPGSTGITCVPSASEAGGCMGGQACLPKTMAASRCIQSPGEVNCPAGPFQNRKVVGAPGDVDDQRKCDACTCTSSAASCSNPTFSGYTSGCTSPAFPAAVTANTCSQTSSGGWDNATHFIYSATPVNQSCLLKGNPPNMNGSIKPKTATTICCQ